MRADPATDPQGEFPPDPSGILGNPFWHALRTAHACFAVRSGHAARYPADVLPFAGLAAPDREALTSLAHLLAPGEAIWTTGDQLPEVPTLELLSRLPGWQMHLASPPPPQPPVAPIQPLSPADAPDMLALTLVAFPGFFRIRTCELGTYFGIRVGPDLVAMAGERVCLPGFHEISAVCTHPAHIGRGYAAALVLHLVGIHAAAGIRSFLHVSAANHRAIALYERLGFTRTRSMLFSQFRRSTAP